MMMCKHSTSNSINALVDEMSEYTDYHDHVDPKLTQYSKTQRYSVYYNR